MKQIPLQIPEGSVVYGDSAYTNYAIGEVLKDAENIDLLVARRIETTLSEISNFLPKKIHAVTEFGFLLKIVVFIFGYAISRTII